MSNASTCAPCVQVGDVFLSAACIAYYGAFTGSYRERLVQVGAGTRFGFREVRRFYKCKDDGAVNTFPPKCNQ